MDELLRWRGEFPILEKSVYLISHSLGAMPRGALEGLREFGEMWASRGVRAWEEGWWESPRIAGDRLARILGAPAGSVAMQPNVSTAQAIVASCFEPSGPRRRFVLCAEDFPSVLYVWERQRRLGAEVVLVPSRDGLSVPAEGILEAIDERTALVAVSQVFYKTAEVLDLAPVVERAHAVGALVLVDAYQGVGTVPLDVGRLGVDFVVGGSVKWLCGGPGAAYLYVRPDLLARLEPRVTGWAAHARPFAFEPPPVAYAADARRMLTGTPAVPALYAAKAGHEMIAAIGVDKIRAKSARQSKRLVERAEERGFRVVSPREPARRGGSVTIDLPHGDALVAALAAREILVDHRPGAGVRVSPHFYTKDEELEAFVREAAAILETKAWVPFEGRGASH
ncbi:MAG TPA: aminotransferase class V-fold PLP-dependent enzyme [Planctomycetota bacterium]|jgi:kynureninase|nr:aminotransferase class V-fold PLP-dependent enzyme [Planctomycetota bacterium]